MILAMGCVPAHASYFSIYEYSKRKFGIDDEYRINQNLKDLGKNRIFVKIG